MRGAALALLILAPMAAAETPTHPAAQCAAFWLGRDDLARRSAYLPRNAEDLRLAEAFRTAALVTTRAADLDRFLKGERHNMALLIEATILGDGQSRRLHDRLAADCGTPP